MFKNFGAPHVAAAFAFVAAIAGWQFYSQSETAEDASSGSVPVVTAEETASAEKVETAEAEEDTAAAEVAQSSSEAVEESATTTETEGTDTDAEAVESDATDEAQAEETLAEDSAAEESPEADTSETQDAPLPIPAFDVVRVETDGTTVVAGTCPAGSLVSIQVDGQDVESGTCDASGQFVLFLNIGDSDQARVMTLSAKQFDTTLLADAQVIIAPVVQQVAAVEAEDVTSDTTSESEGTAEATVEGAEVAEVTEADAAEDATEAVASEATDPVDQVASVEENEMDALSEGSSGSEASAVSATEQSVETDAAEDATEEVASETTDSDEQVASAEESALDASSEDSSGSETNAPSATEQSEEIADKAPTQAKETETTAQAETTVESAETETAPETQTAPAVLLVKDDGVDILQGVGAAPQVMDQLTVAAITYSEEGAVYLSGFSPAGFLRVYLNNTQVIVLEVPEPGEWKAELVDVAPGVYTLRVDQVDADGNVQSRVETPFKREEPEKVVEVAQTRKPLVSLEVVQPGSTLWAISRETYGSGVLFVNIFEANRDQIRDPDLIYPGQIFELPAPPGAKKKKRGSGQ
jgi:nucleoid-associated protein YgaU